MPSSSSLEGKHILSLHTPKATAVDNILDKEYYKKSPPPFLQQNQNPPSSLHYSQDSGSTASVLLTMCTESAHHSLLPLALL